MGSVKPNCRASPDYPKIYMTCRKMNLFQVEKQTMYAIFVHSTHSNTLKRNISYDQQKKKECTKKKSHKNLLDIHISLKYKIIWSLLC